MAPALTLRLFGTPRIETFAGPGPAFGSQPLALLAVLACAGERGMPRDKVLALFWPEATSGRAAHRLSQLVHSIRRRLGPDDVVGGTSDLRLEPERVRCDLWDFEAARREGELERAATLYTGPLLDGFFVPDKLVLYTAMARDAGWGKDFPEMLRNEDWNYAAFTTDKQLRTGVNQAECLACHKPLDKVSYTFTLKQLADAK